MKVDSVSSQILQGRVIGYSWFKPKEKKVFKQVKPCLEKLVKNKNYDLKLYKSYGKELRISAGKKPEYAVIDSNNPAIWISRAKEIIEGFEKERSEKRTF